MITKVILAFWLAVAYDLLAAIDVIQWFLLCFKMPESFFCFNISCSVSSVGSAGNAKVVNSSLTRTTTLYFKSIFMSRGFEKWFKAYVRFFFSANASRNVTALLESWTLLGYLHERKIPTFSQYSQFICSITIIVISIIYYFLIIIIVNIFSFYSL